MIIIDEGFSFLVTIVGGLGKKRLRAFVRQETKSEISNMQKYDERFGSLIRFISVAEFWWEKGC
jgi:hypothetical protein